jgi:processive 1,2-diacylglycerol beta-glucosyltransferase
MPPPPRLLILTAAFGEGHNSAARNLALALSEAGAEARVCDPCLAATPFSTQLLARLYRIATDYLPRVWEKIYYSIDRIDFNRQGLATTRKPQRWLARLIAEFQPTAIVSTYPLYPYLLDRIFKETGVRLPVFTVVTDSMEINSAWLRAPSDFWLVTDPATRESMSGGSVPPGNVIDTGFPVNPVFSRLTPLAADDACAPFRVLFFPTSRQRALTAMGTAILAASPAVRLTVVLGKNVRLLYRAARALQLAHPGRVRLRGWTRRVPSLLTQHHLVVGKAGGATVHEAIAAQCPMLIHHLVPGQEEGNLALLKAIGGGTLAATPAQLTAHLTAMLANQSAGWHAMKHALARHHRNAGAITATRFILAQLDELSLSTKH